MPGWPGTGLGALRVALLGAALLAGAAAAQERRFTLAADSDLAASGLLKYVIPRFSLKTGIRITPVDPAEGAAADALLGRRTAVGSGRPAFARGDALYLCRAAPVDEENERAALARRFCDWIVSDVGQRAVESFAPDGARLYVAAADAPTERDDPAVTGDPLAGKRLSLALCGRCHVVGPENRMNGLGSTPSFAMLRTLGDWRDRFTGFYLLNPHPAFTQIADVTDPFDESRPPPIAPLRLTLDDLEAILAFAAGVGPADLGAEIEHQ